MAIIYGLIGVIILLSIYDFVASRSWQEVTSDERNEVVFADKFQDYGAYEIRKRYSMNLILILLAVIFAFGSAFGIYYFIQSLPDAKIEDTEMDMSAFDQDAKDEKEDELVEPLEPEIPETQKQQQFLEPEVTNQVVDNPPPVQSQFDNTPAGSTTSNGSDFGSSDGSAPPTTPPPTPPKEEVEVYEVVDEQAMFPGGPVALKEYLRDNIKYPPAALDMGIGGTVYLRFVVSTKGTISNVKVQRGIEDCPECSEEAIRVFKSMPAWTPGKNGGKEVNSYFNSKVVFKPS